MKVSEIKINPDNPRFIRDENYKKLLQSIKDFPEMAEARPVVINKDNVILGGNMRFRAMKEAGWTDIPVKVVDWPEEKQKEFVIKDNISGGEWDWDLVAEQYELEELDAWGLSVELPNFEPNSEEQPKLDEKKPIQCPECGHEFTT